MANPLSLAMICDFFEELQIMIARIFIFVFASCVCATSHLAEDAFDFIPLFLDGNSLNDWMSVSTSRAKDGHSKLELRSP